MKTPAFWQSRGAASTLLLPLAYAYEAASSLKRKHIAAFDPGVPVICVGNFTAGGAGKTPVSIAIGKLLKKKNIPAFFLSRGYGGDAAGPMRVDEKIHGADLVGDEPLLLSRILPAIVSKDRAAGARFAVECGAKAIIMDDGLQNPSVKKTLSLAVVDGARGFGNGRLIPCGPLRERPDAGFKRVQALIVLNPNGAPRFGHPVILSAKTEPSPESRAVKGRKIFAFCGIAYPEKFMATLESLGAQIEGRMFFADHHRYRERDMKKIIVRATALKAELATTAKDAVRLPPSLRARAHVVDIEAVFDNPAQMEALLDKALQTDA